MTEWNPRYVCYAKAHGKTPDGMLAYDRERFPGGVMGAFIIWIDQRWAEWRALRGRRHDDPLWIHDHEDFDAWLAAKVET